MKNIATNTLTYTGIVTLSQYIGKKKVQIAQVHNTGGSSLFSFLTNCLLGQFDTARESRPVKVKLLREIQQGDGTTYKAISGFIFVRNFTDKSERPGECRVRYSFMIPRDLFEDISISGLGLGLYSLSATDDNPEEYIAFCTLTGMNVNRNQITNASLLVDWDLIIANTRGTVVTGSDSASPTALA